MVTAIKHHVRDRVKPYGNSGRQRDKVLYEYGDRVKLTDSRKMISESIVVRCSCILRPDSS